MFHTNHAPQILAEAQYAAAVAGLRYISDDETPGIRRERQGGGFRYRGPDGQLIRDRQVRARIQKLAIPPAWTSVWISPDPNAHLSATGRDAKGRKQYRYNPAFVEVRDLAKFGHIIAFAESLPKIRSAVHEHVALRGMPREKVLATIIALLEQTLIRVGNEDYAKHNGSFGLTTLRNRHVEIEGSQLRFLFKGKSGKTWRLSIRNRRVANIVRACQELPGQSLFQYLDEAGEPHKVTSSDVNDYLQKISGREVTAKDFRTWAGTVEAALAFHRLHGAPHKKHVREVVAQVAERLGNTPAICRRCYIHPDVIAAYEAGELALGSHADQSEEDPLTLDKAERAVLRFLKSGRTSAA
jgi:DNA topoisomerase-1